MGSILHMETDAVRQVTRQLQQNSQDLRDQAQTIISTVQQMGWEGPVREQFLGEVDQWRTVLQRHAETIEGLAQQLDREVAEWEQTAEWTGSWGSALLWNGMGGGQNFGAAIESLLGVSSFGFHAANKIDQLNQVAAPFMLTVSAGGPFAGLVLRAIPALQRVPLLGSMYTGTAIRDAAGLGTHLNTFGSASTLVRHTAGQTFRSAFGLTDIALSSGEDWVEDIQDYQHDSGQLASALVIDTVANTVATAAASTAGASIGTWVGAGVGQVLIPIPGVGAAAGALVGGALGRVAGSMAADWAVDTYFDDSQLRSTMITQGDTRIDAFVAKFAP